MREVGWKGQLRWDPVVTEDYEHGYQDGMNSRTHDYVYAFREIVGDDAPADDPTTLAQWVMERVGK